GISESFENGLYVEEGTVLLIVEKLDYEVALINAKQSVADAKVALLMQKAASKSAEEDWYTYNQKDPDPLAVQKPQLNSAKLKYESALKEQALAERNLSETQVKAPFSGWITSRNIEQGDWVHVGTSVGSIIANAPLRAVLKLSPTQVDDLSSENLDELRITLASSGRTSVVKGLTLAPITDQASRQTEAYAYVSPISSDGVRLRPGSFFEAEISFGQEKEFIRIPEGAITKHGTFFVVDKGVARETSLPLAFSASGYRYYEHSRHLPDQFRVVNRWVHKLWDGARVKLKAQSISSSPTRAFELKVPSND
ncbi:MAG: efflux RND transporter periplasmic adaptor subunit, partial [Kordiimonas sp.]